MLAGVAGVAARPAFDVEVSEVMSLGRGAAYRVTSTELSARHRCLQQQWWDSLTPQDRQGFRGHVTVQNKVTPDLARATVDRLRDGFRPFVARALGIAVWRYVGGPWEPVMTSRFESPG